MAYKKYSPFKFSYGFFKFFFGIYITYALSAVYAKKMFGNITLVCDSVGAELLEIIEYNEVSAVGLINLPDKAQPEV